ncbi:Reverse transcriptase domain [Trinorchestia longiramus]|nr:Reverse transcriptase domain [Trinorchestia longiramus]
MAKVEAHGIRDNYSRWIRNWLTGCTQRVLIHDETSDSALVTSGVPQGSVLGPLLFIIYINDLDVGIISKINKFADDTKLCHRVFTERHRATIQSDLHRLLRWTETWQMSFNIEKRNNCQKLLLRNFKTSQAMNFFPVKIAATWNQLPENIVSAGTVNIFRNILDKFWITNPPSITSY